MLLLYPLAVTCLSLAGCDQQSPGEPIVRTPIKPAGAGGQVAAGDVVDEPPVDDPAAQVESSCRSVIFENTPFTHCLAVPSRHRVTTVLAGSDKQPFRGFAAFGASRPPGAAPVAFAFNGGMFDDEGRPIGYYVENGERLKTINTADGEGNFHMDPNGVFFGDDQRWRILTAQDFVDNVQDRPQFGTQSGPMLVIEGELHPEIAADGESRLVRNAVGVDEQGRAHFVISNAAVSFGKLARLYRDKLEVDNALYLDGNVSALWNPASGRMDAGAPLGPLIVVEKRTTPP